MHSASGQAYQTRQRTAWRHLAASSRRRAQVCAELAHVGMRPSLLRPARKRAGRPWVLLLLSVSFLLAVSVFSWSVGAFVHQDDSNAATKVMMALSESATTAATHSSMASEGVLVVDETASPDVLVNQGDGGTADRQSHAVIEADELLEGDSRPRPSSKVVVNPSPKHPDSKVLAVELPKRLIAQPTSPEIEQQGDPASKKSRLLQFGSAQDVAVTNESGASALSQTTQPKPVKTQVLVLGVAVDGWLQVQNVTTGRILSIAQGSTLSDGRKVISATLEHGYVLED